MFLFFDGILNYFMKANRNRKSLVYLLVIFIYSGISAQPSNLSVLKVGIKQGIVFSQVNFDPPVTQNLTLGYTGGLAIQYISETHAGIQAEFNYSQRGWTEKLDSSNSYKRTLNYFEVPVLSHFIYTQKKTTFFLNLGPAISFYSSGRETFHLTHQGDTLPY